MCCLSQSGLSCNLHLVKSTSCVCASVDFSECVWSGNPPPLDRLFPLPPEVPPLPCPSVTSPLAPLLATTGRSRRCSSRVFQDVIQTEPHGTITRHLLNVLLRTPLRAGFPRSPQAENLIFPFYLTQPLPHAGISSAVALIIVFRLPGNYQSSVKASRQCESTQDEGGPRPAHADTCIQRGPRVFQSRAARTPRRPQGLQGPSTMLTRASAVAVAAAGRFS